MCAMPAEAFQYIFFPKQPLTSAQRGENTLNTHLVFFITWTHDFTAQETKVLFLLPSSYSKQYKRFIDQWLLRISIAKCICPVYSSRNIVLLVAFLPFLLLLTVLGLLLQKQKAEYTCFKINE